MLEIETLVLGPVETNVYLAADSSTADCVVIDPAWNGAHIVRIAEAHGWTIREIWLTHAHFDHIGGVNQLVKQLGWTPNIRIHPADMSLWREKGGAALFGLSIDPGPEPTEMLHDQELLKLGKLDFQVKHTPGHTPGHVVFYSESERIVFCGDLIFAGGIGRTDLPGGSFQKLMDSIHQQILTLDDDVLLFAGHGESTRVGIEKTNNYYLKKDFFSSY